MRALIILFGARERRGNGTESGEKILTAPKLLCLIRPPFPIPKEGHSVADISAVVAKNFEK